MHSSVKLSIWRKKGKKKKVLLIEWKSQEKAKEKGRKIITLE